MHKAAIIKRIDELVEDFLSKCSPAQATALRKKLEAQRSTLSLKTALASWKEKNPPTITTPG